MFHNKLPETFTGLNIEYMPLLILTLNIFLKQSYLRALVLVQREMENLGFAVS